MAWYRRLPFAGKLRLFPALAGAALGVVLLVNAAFGIAAERRLARVGESYYPRVESMWRLDHVLAETRQALADVAASPETDGLRRADSLAGAFVRGLRARGSLADDPGHATLRALFDAYYAAGRDVAERAIGGETGSTLAAAVRLRDLRYGRLKRTLAEDARQDRAVMIEEFNTVREQQRFAFTAGVGLMLLAVAALAMLSRLTTKSLTEPLREAVRAADRVADGELQLRLPDVGADEVGHLLRSMERMVTNLRRSESRLAHQATHDALTGLPNRALLRDRLAAALEACHDGRTVAVLFVDLDDFKGVNDGLGHEFGDQLLVAVAERLLNATRGCDTAARLGGDEFALLLTGIRHPGEALIVAERVIHAIGSPFQLAGSEVRTGASVGIALGTDATGVHDLLQCADLAMYAAKNDGRGRYRRFEAAMHAAVRQRVELESNLRVALARRELLLHYQPIVDLRTRAVVGAEALVRWQHPERGLISPLDFIPLAESTGLIVPIGAWVLDEACSQAAMWSSGATPFRISVNVSAAQILDADMLDAVRVGLAMSGLPPAALTLEITESVMITDTEATLARLHELKALGVSLAIDDFGTGYSSLKYLHRLPVDILKIDRSFISAIGSDTHDPSITRAIVALAGALGLRMVAEGVERAEQVEALRFLGCEFGQGYHFSRPVPAEEFTARLRTTGEGATAPDAEPRLGVGR